MTVAEIAIYRVANGKIVEHWVAPDVWGLVRQPGADSSVETSPGEIEARFGLW